MALINVSIVLSVNDNANTRTEITINEFLLLNNNFMKDLLKNNNNYIYRDYNFIDSINIDISMSNKIEKYNIQNTFF